MTADSTFDFWGVVRRNWWIVVLAALAGAAIAVVATLGAKTLYTGKTYLTVNNVAVNTYPQMPRPDTLIAQSGDAAFLEGVAKRLGLSPKQVAGAYKVYSTGNPQNQLWVSFTSPDRAAAEKGANAVAEQLQTVVAESSRALMEQLQGSVTADEESLALLDQPKTQLEQYYLWSIRRTLYADRGSLKLAESGYQLDAPVTVASSSRRNAAISAAAGGLVAGLFLGIALVAVRETVSRRRGSTASA